MPQRPVVYYLSLNIFIYLQHREVDIENYILVNQKSIIVLAIMYRHRRGDSDATSTCQLSIKKIREQH